MGLAPVQCASSGPGERSSLSSEEVHRPPALARAGALGAVLALVVRGDVCYLLFPPTLAALAVGVGGLAIAGGSVWWGLQRFPGAPAAIRAIWMAPLGYAAGVAGLAMATLRLPSWLGIVDAWPRWTGLPPEDLIPLAMGGAGALLAITLVLAWAALRRYLVAFALRGEVEREPWALPLVLALGLLLGGLVLGVQDSQRGLLAQLRAFVAMRMGRPESSLQTLRGVLRRDPHGHLTDSVLYRMARIHLDHLGQPDHAAGLLERLLREFPASPWRDDAGLRLAWAHRRALRPAAYREALASLRRREPDSPHRGRAGLELAEALLEDGRTDEARELYAALLREGGVLRDRSRYPWDLAWVADVAAARLAEWPR